MTDHIRNFVIIAHVDHGKSTLADRLLEETHTIEKRNMKPQYLDQLESERERGITIKMAPVRMLYKLTTNNQQQTTYVLNLIDTPGHSDFSYEVSRALASVEGAVLLVDVSQGIQAQTLVNFRLARNAGLKIIGAVNKIDLQNVDEEMINAAIKELADLLEVPESEILKVSGKTGQGVYELLGAIIEKIPPPKISTLSQKQALVFDSAYDEHKGIIAFVRVFEGTYKIGDGIKLLFNNQKCKIKELGHFSPKLKPVDELREGEIGYIVSGIKDLGVLKIGDTIGDPGAAVALPGYKEPQPVVFVSLYPDDADQYEDFKAALSKLRLNDSSLHIEPDINEVLGRGFKCGFLGQLHFEITAERLEKEFNIETIGTFPFVAYKVCDRRLTQAGTPKYPDESGATGQAQTNADPCRIIKNIDELADDAKEIQEPMIQIEIITPAKYLSNVLQLREPFRVKNIETTTFENKMLVAAKMPLTSLLSDFDGQLKSVSEGMASFSYELEDYEPAYVEKVRILVAGDPVPGLARLMYKDEIDYESRKMLAKLKEVLPRQQFSQSLQAEAHGKIIARENITALRKDVTGYLYGGDRTRKMKLWKKQKKGKAKLKEMGRVRISASD